MDLWTLAMKDIFRRKGKSFYVICAIAIPVAILSTILLTIDNADKSLSQIASKFGYTMTLQPKNLKVQRIDQIGVVLDEYLPESVVKMALEIIKAKGGHGKRGTETISSPRLYYKTEIAHKGAVYDGVVAGMNFATEREAKPSWNLTDGEWPKAREVILGGTFAESRQLYPGDVLEINAREFTVSGILENYNSSEDYMLFLSLPEAQDVFDKEKTISVLNLQSVTLDRNPDLLQQVLAELNSSIPNIKAITPQQFSSIKYVMLKRTFKFLFSIILATVFVSIFSIFNIITSTLLSRVKEVGLLKAAGASRSQLLKIFLYEYCIIGLIGGVLGYPVGTLMSYLMDSYLLNIGASVNLSIVFVGIAVITGILCSFTASVYPTYKLSKIKITNAFRTQWEG
ncbi:MAG: FtsX-like permease family protein [Deltaproteobacteria bacterium]